MRSLLTKLWRSLSEEEKNIYKKMHYEAKVSKKTNSRAGTRSKKNKEQQNKKGDLCFPAGCGVQDILLQNQLQLLTSQQSSQQQQPQQPQPCLIERQNKQNYSYDTFSQQQQQQQLQLQQQLRQLQLQQQQQLQQLQQKQQQQQLQQLQFQPPPQPQQQSQQQLQFQSQQQTLPPQRQQPQQQQHQSQPQQQPQEQQPQQLQFQQQLLNHQQEQKKEDLHIESLLSDTGKIEMPAFTLPQAIPTTNESKATTLDNIPLQHQTPQETEPNKATIESFDSLAHPVSKKEEPLQSLSFGTDIISANESINEVNLTTQIMQNDGSDLLTASEALM